MRRKSIFLVAAGVASLCAPLTALGAGPYGPYDDGAYDGSQNQGYYSPQDQNNYGPQGQDDYGSQDQASGYEQPQYEQPRSGRVQYEQPRYQTQRYARQYPAPRDQGYDAPYHRSYASPREQAYQSYHQAPSSYGGVQADTANQGQQWANAGTQVRGPGWAAQDARWSDAAHHRDRIALVRGAPEFANQESALRSEFDAGLREGWLDHDDFLIFGRQLHQTGLDELKAMRRNGGTLSDNDRAFIQNTLDEVHKQLDETHYKRNVSY